MPRLEERLGRVELACPKSAQRTPRIRSGSPVLADSVSLPSRHAQLHSSAPGDPD